jgi:hypothetical protein
MSNLRDPFKPKTGEFANNIRAIIHADDSELRSSLKQFGWRKEFPAYKDEHGVVLVGHRRLKIAEEEGIAPVIAVLTIGDGNEADAERLKIALASNIGFAPMGKQDRARIAKYLYGEREWKMDRIAEALNVSTATIGRDLEEYSHNEKTQPRQSKRGRTNEGRPKGSRKRPPKPPKTQPLVPRLPPPHIVKDDSFPTEVTLRNTIAYLDAIEKRLLPHLLEGDRLQRALGHLKKVRKVLAEKTGNANAALPSDQIPSELKH